jgi:hypothetical protein
MVKHTIRSAKADGKTTMQVSLVRSTAIKAFCTECMGFQEHPKDCPDVHCPLYPFRGKSLIAYLPTRKKQSE